MWVDELNSKTIWRQSKKMKHKILLEWSYNIININKDQLKIVFTYKKRPNEYYSAFVTLSKNLLHYLFIN